MIVNRLKLLTFSATFLVALSGGAYADDAPANAAAAPAVAATTATTAAAPATPAAAKPADNSSQKTSGDSSETNNDQPLYSSDNTPVKSGDEPFYDKNKVEVSNVDIGYVKVEALPKGKGQINPIRWQALHDTAMSLGATGALAWRSEQINASLMKNTKELTQIFDFNQLLLKDDVLPPVLVESNNDLNLASDDSIRLSAKTYQILSPARFVTAAPNWRTYLWMNYKKPPVPDRSLLPRNQAEADVWNRSIKLGWAQGIRQGNAIFASNLNRLRRDYNGMILYRKLLAQGMVSAPYVAKADLGVTGDSKQIRINDRVLRITSHSEMQTDASKWKPILTDKQP